MLFPTPSTARDVSVLQTILAEPALIFLGCVAIAAALIGAVLWRRRGRVRDMATRPVVADYLAGVEDALGLDHASARVRLERVLRVDPENGPARVLLAQALLGQGEVARAHEEQRVVRESFGFAGRRCDAIGAAALLATDAPGEAARLLGAHGRDAEEGHLRLRLRAELAAGALADAVATAERLATRCRPAEAEVLQDVLAQATGLLAPTRSPARGADPGPPGPDLARRAAAVSERPFECRRCRLRTPQPGLACPHCGEEGGLRAREPGLSQPLAAASLVADEIEQTPAHLERLLGAAVRGDDRAKGDLIALGPAAVAVLWRRALGEPEARPCLADMFVAMGPRALPALLEELTAARDATPGVASSVGLEFLGGVVERLGRAALPQFAELVPSEDPDLRKLVIDYHIALADGDELAVVLDHYPPVEILQRLNASPSARLQGFLAAMPPRGFVVDVLLVHPMFHRDEEILFAAVRAPDPEVLLAVLTRRGAHALLARRAVAMLDDDATAATAERFLAAAGGAVTDALLAAYLDLDRAPEARARLRRLLASVGPTLVPSLCQCFGGAPARLDQEVAELLVALGAPAVGPLRDAYERRNLLERVGGRLVRRYNHPRNLIIKVLAKVGGPSARRALQELRAGEADPNLKLRLEQALHAIANSPEDMGDGFGADLTGEGRVG